MDQVKVQAEDGISGDTQLVSFSFPSTQQRLPAQSLYVQLIHAQVKGL